MPSRLFADTWPCLPKRASPTTFRRGCLRLPLIEIPFLVFPETRLALADGAVVSLLSRRWCSALPRCDRYAVAGVPGHVVVLDQVAGRACRAYEDAALQVSEDLIAGGIAGQPITLFALSSTTIPVRVLAEIELSADRTAGRNSHDNVWERRADHDAVAGGWSRSSSR